MWATTSARARDMDDDEERARARQLLHRSVPCNHCVALSEKSNQDVIFQCLIVGEGSTPGPLSPPLAPTKAFSRSGCGRIFPLFARVMREGLSTGNGARRSSSCAGIRRMAPRLSTGNGARRSSSRPSPSLQSLCSGRDARTGPDPRVTPKRIGVRQCISLQLRKPVCRSQGSSLALPPEGGHQRDTGETGR